MTNGTTNGEKKESDKIPPDLTIEDHDLTIEDRMYFFKCNLIHFVLAVVCLPAHMLVEIVRLIRVLFITDGSVYIASPTTWDWDVWSQGTEMDEDDNPDW